MDRLKTKRQQGFTLAELLIALAILGVIATFTIPKILDSGSTSQKTAIAKEAISYTAEAFQVYKLNNAITAATTKDDLFLNSLNYVAIDTTSSVDGTPLTALATYDCFNPNQRCLKMHNGSILSYSIEASWASFSSTETTCSVSYRIDTDGVITGNRDALWIFLYPTGRITTRAHILASTYSGTNGPFNPTGNTDPSWFSWSN